jgi:hypothetical protein
MVCLGDDCPLGFRVLRQRGGIMYLVVVVTLCLILLNATVLVEHYLLWNEADVTDDTGVGPVSDAGARVNPNVGAAAAL